MTRRERLERRASRRQEWSGKAAAWSSAAYAGVRRISDGIPMGQPVLVGHHSERHHRRDIQRMDDGMRKSVEQQKLSEHHEQKARGIEIQLERSIFSDDENAIEALEAKAKKCDESAAQCNRINRAWRKGGRAAVAAEFSEGIAAAAEKLCAQFSWLARKGPMEATSDRAEARRCRERIKVIQAQRARTEKAEAAGGVTIGGSEDWAVVTFADKPHRDVLLALREAGYRWGGGSWHGSKARLPAEVSELAGEAPVPDACYAAPREVDELATGYRDRRPEGGLLELACGKHAEPRLGSIPTATDVDCQGDTNMESTREVGPALGMKYRDEVLRYAASNSQNPGWDGIVGLSNSELAEVIGPASSINEALDLAYEKAIQWLELHPAVILTMKGSGALGRPGEPLRPSAGGVRSAMIVIGCGKAKLAEKARARELYTGSLFVAARRYAEASGQRWGILSAEHGFLRPDVEVAPYERKLRLKGVQLREWAIRAARECGEYLGRAPGPVEVLAGHPYAWPFRNELLWLVNVESTEPLEGLGLGQRLQWLKEGRERFEGASVVGGEKE